MKTRIRIESKKVLENDKYIQILKAIGHKTVGVKIPLQPLHKITGIPVATLFDNLRRIEEEEDLDVLIVVKDRGHD